MRFSLFPIARLFGVALYLAVGGLSYVFVFDKTYLRHPKFLPNQVRLEIHTAMQSLPVMAVLTLPLFLAEVRGYSKLCDRASEAWSR
jgi:lathosterol oxidase